MATMKYMMPLLGDVESHDFNGGMADTSSIANLSYILGGYSIDTGKYVGFKSWGLDPNAATIFCAGPGINFFESSDIHINLVRHDSCMSHLYTPTTRGICTGFNLKPPEKIFDNSKDYAKMFIKYFGSTKISRSDRLE